MKRSSRRYYKQIAIKKKMNEVGHTAQKRADTFNRPNIDIRGKEGELR